MHDLCYCANTQGIGWKEVGAASNRSMNAVLLLLVTTDTLSVDTLRGGDVSHMWPSYAETRSQTWWCIAETAFQ